jgi:hypothetical protein
VTRRVAAAVAACAVAALTFGAPAPAATQIVTLPNAAAILQGEPPLAPPATVVREIRLPRLIGSDERVVAGLALDGTPRSVRVVQRLDLRGLGDYTFSVPAPARSVAAGPGSESQPGLRLNEIPGRASLRAGGCSSRTPTSAWPRPRPPCRCAWTSGRRSAESRSRPASGRAGHCGRP